MWDVICLQEVDLHSELFEDHPTFKGDKFDNGSKWSVAIYYNADKFEEIESVERRYLDPETMKEQS